MANNCQPLAPWRLKLSGTRVVFTRHFVAAMIRVGQNNTHDSKKIASKPTQCALGTQIRMLLRHMQVGRMLRGHWLFAAGLIVILFSLGIRTTETSTPIHVGGELLLENWDFQRDGVLKLEQFQRVAPPPITDGLQPAVRTYQLILRGLTDTTAGLLIEPKCGSGAFYFEPLTPGTSTMAPGAEPLLRLGELPGMPSGLATQAANPISATSISTANAGLAPRLVALPVTNAPDYRLTLHSYNPTLSPERFCFDVRLGNVSQLYEATNRQLINVGLIIAVIFSIALYAFGMYFQSHTNASNLWLGLWASTAVIFFWSQEKLWEMGFDVHLTIHQILHYKIEYTALLLLGPLGVNYYRHAYESVLSDRLFTINNALAVIACGMVLSVNMPWLDEHLLWIFIYSATQFLIIVTIMGKAIIERRPDASLSLLSVAPLFVTIPLDFLIDVEIIPDQTLSQYAWVFFMFIHCIIQSNRFSETVRKTSKESESLAIAVARQTESLEEKNRQLLMVQSELHRANKELEALSITDGLSGAFNRLYFDRQFEAEWQRSRREKQAFSIILLDVDYFKKINDRYGHPAGDQCIKTITRWLQLTFKRSQDLVCRYGGEEFAILLPNTTPDAALTSAEQLRQLIEETPVTYQDKEIFVTVSIGVSGIIPDGPYQPDDLLRVVDKALYSVKNAGRNGVCLKMLDLVTPSVD